MKINIEDYLHKIDHTFKDKSQKDIYMTYVMVFSVIFAFSYLLFWDTSEGNFLQEQKKISTLQSKIDLDEIYLKYNPQTKVNNLGSNIKSAEDELFIHKDTNDYIKSKIETISSLIYDDRTWGEYLNSISKSAKKYNIKILNFTNEYASTNQAFGHILDITLKVTGNYTNTLKFINALEQSDLVVDIHNLSIKAQDTLNTDLNISVWGITY